VKVEPASTLLEALRIQLGLTGAKEVCDRGACGACSVIIDGKLVNSCMTFAVDCVGSKITTVEGIGTPEAMDPLQTAFVRHDAMQCGYCTPGFIVACRAFLMDHPKPTLEQIKHGLGGNICRCGTYTNIFNAVLEASGQSPVVEQKA
jgi:xanthine dehydrogenase YagT iron-sulfur-binding subunit